MTFKFFIYEVVENTQNHILFIWHVYDSLVENCVCAWEFVTINTYYKLNTC